MYCGHLKQICKSITVQELIDILETCKDKNTIVKVLDTTNFYIHFDKDGQFINISKSAMNNQYGNGTNSGCEGCNRYDKAEKVCKCDGINCLNASMIVNTEKFNKLHSSIESVSISSKNQASRSDSKNDKYDLDNLSINGINSNNKKEDKKEEVKVNTMDSKEVQLLIDNAIVNTRTKMISGIKGDK